MQINIHFARDTDGRWVAEIPEFTGAVGFGANKAEAKAAALVMAREISIAELKDSEPRTVTSGVCSPPNWCQCGVVTKILPGLCLSDSRTEESPPILVWEGLSREQSSEHPVCSASIRALALHLHP